MPVDIATKEKTQPKAVLVLNFSSFLPYLFMTLNHVTQCNGHSFTNIIDKSRRLKISQNVLFLNFFNNILITKYDRNAKECNIKGMKCHLVGKLKFSLCFILIHSVQRPFIVFYRFYAIV